MMRRAVAAVVCTLAAVPAQEPRSEVLDNGLRVVTLERPALPLVTFALYLRGGLLLDRAPTFRHTSLAMGLLWMGHGELGEDTVREALADIGADYGSHVDLQCTRVHLSCLATHAERGLALFADALLRPAFAEAVVAREREQELRMLAQRSKRAEFLAQEALHTALAANHPLADAFALHDREGALAEARRSQVVAAWQRQVQPQLGTLFVVGRGTAGLLDTVRARLGGWAKPEAPTVPVVPELPADTPGQVVKVPLPEMTQVYLQLGMVGPRLDDPLAPAVHVLRLALAGGFTSALPDELRVNRGLVYYINFTNPSLTIAPPYSLTTATRPDKVSEVLDVTRGALRAAAQGSLRPAQIEAARNLWLGAQALARETQLGAADALYKSQRLFGDFAGCVREAAAVAAATPDDVAKAAARFDPDRFVVVMVGAPEALAQIEWSAK